MKKYGTIGHVHHSSLYRQAILQAALMRMREAQIEEVANKKKLQAEFDKIESTFPHDWEIDAKKKNGKRPHVCVECKQPFLGNRRRISCFRCYQKNFYVQKGTPK